MVKFLSILVFLRFLQFFLGFQKFPFFLCHSVQQPGFMNLGQKYHKRLHKTYCTMAVSVATATVTW